MASQNLSHVRVKRFPIREAPALKKAYPSETRGRKVTGLKGDLLDDSGTTRQAGVRSLRKQRTSSYPSVLVRVSASQAAIPRARLFLDVDSSPSPVFCGAVRPGGEV